MPPPDLTGPRDRFGAIIQLPNAGTKLPYAWFVWHVGFRGVPGLKWLPLVSLKTKRAIEDRR